MVIALLTTDNRQDSRQFDRDRPWFGTAPEALMQGLAALPEVKVHVVSCAQQPMKSPEKLADNIWFHSLHVPKFGWLRTGYQGCIRAVRRKLWELQPDIVHGQGTERDCCISAVFSGLPNVLTVHGNMRLISQVNAARAFSYQWLAARLEEFTIPRSAGVVCITGYTRQAMTGLARKTWVVPNAVDATFFEVPRRPRPEPTILCVGNISLRKNQNPFIEALDPLARERSLKVVFLGSTAGEPEYVRRFQELLRTRPWCQYGGMASRGDLKEHLGGASALVLPSLEDNCPMVVLEAMAAGVPVAASRVGGIPELITDDHNGLMFDPLRPEAMAAAVRRILSESTLAGRLAHTARNEAFEKYHPKSIARRHLAIYREVLSRSE